MTTEYIIYALMVVAFFTVYMALVHLFRRDSKKSRIQRTAADAFYEAQEEKKTPELASFCAAVVALTGVDVKNQKELQVTLSQAGINSPYAAHYFLFFKRILQPIILVLGVYFFIKGITSVGIPGSKKASFLLVGAFCALIGMFGAQLYVSNARQKRQKKLLRSFPEGLDLLLVCIESGLGLDAALGRVCAELSNAHPELGQELERTRIELTMMSDRAQALQNLAERTQILPFKSLVASLIQTEKFGTSLLDTLRVLSEDQRVTRLLNAENKAAKIPVLITIPLIFCIMPSFMIIILGPPIVRVIEMGGIMGDTDKKK